MNPKNTIVPLGYKLVIRARMACIVRGHLSSALEASEVLELRRTVASKSLYTG
jgi:hypothetical protein